MNRILVIILLFSVLFGSCNSNDTCDNMTLDHVCVKLINQSGQNIKLLTLTHEQGQISIDELANNSQTSLKFNSPGENEYNILVIFEDGDSLMSPGTYTEGGYSITELISPDSIQTKYHKY